MDTLPENDTGPKNQEGFLRGLLNLVLDSIGWLTGLLALSEDDRLKAGILKGREEQEEQTIDR